MRKTARTSDAARKTDALEQALIEVWRQVLVEDTHTVKLDDREYPVHTTLKRRLREVDFSFGNRELRGLEQNPKTGSRWAALARRGKKVMQFIEHRRYIGVVVDGKLTLYKKAR